jgi:hypothetical protein
MLSYRKRKLIADEEMVRRTLTGTVAVVDSKPHRVIRIINSPAFLWFASAISLSAAGTYYSDFQRCTSEAAQIDEKFYKVANELKNRRMKMYAAIKNAPSPIYLKDLNSVKGADFPYMYSEFKGLSIHDIEYQYDRLVNRIDMSEINESIKDFFDRNYSDYNRNYSDYRERRFSYTEIGRYLPISSNNFSQMIWGSEYELTTLKAAAKYEYTSFIIRHKTEEASVIISQCGPSTIMTRIFYSPIGIPVAKFYKHRLIEIPERFERLHN